jgi:hypothetical protein
VGGGGNRLDREGFGDPMDRRGGGIRHRHRHERTERADTKPQQARRAESGNCLRRRRYPQDLGTLCDDPVRSDCVPSGSSAAKEDDMIPAMMATILILLTGLSSAYAADWKELEGSYVVSGEDYLDPAPDTTGDTHLFVQMHGQGAEDLFTAMPGPAQPDACTGGVAKRSGQMTCLHFKSDDEARKRYECSFSIDIARQVIQGGVAC